jgi:predicted dehydrogenase
MSRRFRAAIVGAGRKAGPIDDELPEGDRSWLRPWGHAPAYKALPNCELVGVADPDTAKLDAFCERYGVAREGRYADYREMIQRERPDLVSLTTWATLRAETAVFAVENGVKGIFSEKALACSLEEADRIRDACTRHGVAFNYGAGRRYRPGFRAIKKLADGGELGNVLQCVFTGGPSGLFHSVSHAVDTALFFLEGRTVESVQATLSKASFDRTANRWEADPSLANAYVRFTDGTGATFTVNGGRWHEFNLLGSAAVASVLDNNARYVLRRRSDDWFGATEAPFPAFEDESDTVVAIRELTEAIAAGTPV